MVLLLVALRLPSLTWGFGFDDWVHQAVLGGGLEHPSLRAWSLFDFGGPPQESGPLWELGGWPFWADTDFRARFFRPLTSLWIAGDHALFGSDPVGYHASQLLGFALLLAMLLRLWRRCGVPASTALLALCIFGLEDGSTAAVGWIANRSTLLAALGLAGGALALTRGSGAGALLGGLVALGAKESGVGVLLVLGLAAHRGWLCRPRRAVALACGLIALAYAGTYFALGFGARSSFYPAPWVDLSTFLFYLSLHLSAGLASAACPTMTDAALFEPHMAAPVTIFGAMLVLALLRPVARSARALPAGPFLVAVGVLTFLPQILATPSDRLGFVPMVGWAPLLAVTVARGRRAGGLPRAAATVLALSMLVLSPLTLVVVQRGFGQHFEEARVALEEAEVGDPGLGRREVFVLQPTIGPLMLGVAAQYAVTTGDTNVRWWPLQNARRGLELERTGARSMIIRSTDDPFLIRPFEYVFRTTRAVPEVGRTWTLAFHEVRLIEVDEHGARAFELEARDDLDARHVRFLAYDGERMVHIEPPAPGERLTLPPAPEPFPFAP